MGGVPTMLLAMMEHPDFASATCRPASRRFRRLDRARRDRAHDPESTLGVQFSIVFGQTECSAVATQTRLDDSPDDKAETIGRPLPQIEVKVIDRSPATSSRPATLGELCVRGFW